MTWNALDVFLTFVKSVVSTTIFRNLGKLLETNFLIISAITSLGSQFFLVWAVMSIAGGCGG